MYSRTFCGHLNVLYIFDPTCTKYRFEVRLELYGANAAPPYSSLSPPDATAKPMASSHHFTPPQVSPRLAPLV